MKKIMMGVAMAALASFGAAAALAEKVSKSWGTYWECGMTGHEAGNPTNTLSVVAGDMGPGGGFNSLLVGGVTVTFGAGTGNYYAGDGSLIVTPHRDPVTLVVTVTVNYVLEARTVEFVDWQPTGF